MFEPLVLVFLWFYIQGFMDMSQAPQAKYRKDYKAPSHHITDIDLTFDLYDNDTIVTAVSK